MDIVHQTAVHARRFSPVSGPSHHAARRQHERVNDQQLQLRALPPSPSRSLATTDRATMETQAVFTVNEQLLVDNRRRTYVHTTGQYAHLDGERHRTVHSRQEKQLANTVAIARRPILPCSSMHRRRRRRRRRLPMPTATNAKSSEMQLKKTRAGSATRVDRVIHRTVAVE